MANAIGKVIEAAGGGAKVVSMKDISLADLKTSGVFTLGCPAIGDGEYKSRIPS